MQVFLARDDRARLDRLTAQLEASKSDVLRRSLVALEQQLLDPATHPALRVIGLVADDPGLEHGGHDVAVEHDRHLVAQHEPAPPPRRRPRRGKS